MRRRVAAGVFVALLVLGGCSTSHPKLTALRDPLADLPATALAEPKLKARSARLLEKAGQVYNFCEAQGHIDNLKEPIPTDLGKALPYARLYYATLRSLNADESWKNPRRNAAGAPKKLQLFDEQRQALKVERAEIFAYLARLQVTDEYAKAKLLTPVQVRARLTDAFSKLADGPYLDADDTLTRFAQESCQWP